MRFKPTVNTKIGVAVLMIGLAAAALAQAGKSLTYKGGVISHDVRIISGRPYVPLADAAKMVGGTAVRSAGGYEIRAGDVDTTTPDAGDAARPGTAGGANQVSGLSGKVGQTLFTGKWRFQVVSVDRVGEYPTRFRADKDTIQPNGDNDELVVVTCQLRNAQKQAISPSLSYVHPHNTALTDNQGQSYPPLCYDKRGGDNDTGGSMLPGSSTTFAVLFSVPKGTSLKDMVFTLQHDYEDGGTDVRISLAGSGASGTGDSL